MLVNHFLYSSFLIVLYNGLGILANPWNGYMDRWNIPLAHGSGVYTDLGHVKSVKGAKYREPAGRCPNWGKIINLEQPTKNSVIWPRNYLERVPTAKSVQDTKPVGGGLALWRTIPADISPLTITELKEKVEKFKKQEMPYPLALHLLEDVKSDFDYCTWWSLVTYAADSSSSDFYEKYRYPFVWNESTKTCTLLSIAMQHLQGSNVCTSGDADENTLGSKDWYCMHGEKPQDEFNKSWNSPYIRSDYREKCPNYGVLNGHFGQYDSTYNTCMRLAVVKKLTNISPEECANQVFQHSASDAPNKYTSTPTLNGLYKDWSAGLGHLWPFNAFGADTPHSQGVGINYANWYINNTCELYDSVPNCFVYAPGQYAYTGLSSPSRYLSEPPPCNSASQGWVVEGECNCGFYEAKVYECDGSSWSTSNKSCNCNLGLYIGLGIGIPLALLLICGLAFYFYRRKKRGSKEEKKSLLSTANTGSSYMNPDEITKDGGKKGRRSDFKQEAEPSFWGENDDDEGPDVDPHSGEDTNIIISGEPSDFYYE